MGIIGDDPDDRGLVNHVEPDARRTSGLAPRSLPALVAVASVALIGGLLWLVGPAEEGPDSQAVSSSVQPAFTTSQPRSTAWASAGQFGDGYLLPDGLVPIDVAWDEQLVVLAQDEPIDSVPPSARFYRVGLGGIVHVESEPIGGAPFSIAAGDGSVWIGRPDMSAITRHSRDTGRELQRFERDNFAQGPLRIKLAGGAAWLVTSSLELVRLDPETGESTPVINRGVTSFDVVEGDGYLWAATDSGAARIDLADNSVEVITAESIGHRVARVGFDGENVFALNGGGVVSVISGDPPAVVRSLNLPIRLSRFGWIDSVFGAIRSGELWHLGSEPELILEASITNYDDSNRFAQLGQEFWMIDSDARTVEPVREVRRLERSRFAIPVPGEDWPLNPDDLSPDWVELAAIPEELAPGFGPGVRIALTDGILIWGGERNGTSMVATGRPGYIYRPEADRWDRIADDPYAGEFVGFIYTGHELVTWRRGEAAAYEPESDTWRTIDDWPLMTSSRQIVVWTGDEIVDVRFGIAVDPVDGSSRRLADPPNVHERGRATLVDGLIVLLTGEGAYDIARDEWVRLPSSGLTPLSVDGVASSDGLVAVDYLMNAAVLNAETQEWDGYPPLPIRFTECGAGALLVAGRPVADSCLGWAAWDAANSWWTPIAHPVDDSPPGLLAGGDDLYAMSRGRFFRLGPEVLSDPEPAPQRIAIGVRTLELQDGWELSAVVNEVAEAPITLILAEADQPARCEVTATHSEYEPLMRRLLTAETELISVRLRDGGSTDALWVPAGGVDDFFHIVWAVGTTDVIDIACNSGEAAEEIAALVGL